MAVPHEHELRPVDARELATAFADIVGADPVVERMWVSEHRGVVSFWLLTRPAEADDERRLYLSIDRLYDRFGDIAIRLHLINPRNYEPLELDVVLPQGADEIALTTV